MFSAVEHDASGPRDLPGGRIWTAGIVQGTDSNTRQTWCMEHDLLRSLSLRPPTTSTTQGTVRALYDTVHHILLTLRRRRECTGSNVILYTLRCWVILYYCGLYDTVRYCIILYYCRLYGTVCYVLYSSSKLLYNTGTILSMKSNTGFNTRCSTAVYSVIVFSQIPYLGVCRNSFQNTTPTMDFVYRFGIGLTAGTLASIANIPFDVAKSRIQGPQPSSKTPGLRKYNGCFQTIALVYKEEGFLALYKGLLPKIMRLGPGTVRGTVRFR